VLLHQRVRNFSRQIMLLAVMEVDLLFDEHCVFHSRGILGR